MYFGLFLGREQTQESKFHFKIPNCWFSLFISVKVAFIQKGLMRFSDKPNYFVCVIFETSYKLY